ncbi:hypothetical protein [Sinomicrobium sp.]
MKKLFLYIWIPFTLYFVFVHPAIIYYNVNTNVDLAGRDGKTALMYLGLSLLLWGGILLVTLFQIYKNSFVARKNVEYLLQKGVRIDAKVLEAKQLKSLAKEMVKREVLLEFRNLRGEEIQYKMQLNDSGPGLNRYVPGNHIFLRVDPEYSKHPYVVLEGVKTKINYGLFVVWGVFALGIIGWYYYCYINESAGYGWRFISWEHPLITSAAMFLLFGFIFKAISSSVFRRNGRASDKLYFLGLKARAKVFDISQTGTYINEQPEVKFDLEFKDERGTVHQTSIKKIVSLIEIGKLEVGERDIFYLPEDPHRVVFSNEKTNGAL